MTKSALVLLAALTPLLANANGVERLKAFLQGSTHFEASFSQFVMSPSKEVVSRSQGDVAISRPNRFRWNYRTPYEQLIVSDGSQVYLYDKDLEQVTVRGMQSGIGQAPIFLLAGSRAVESEYTLRDMGTTNGYEWVEVRPKRQGSEFGRIMIGFDGQNPAVLDLQDSLGQSTQIQFSGARAPNSISAQTFNFRIPNGVDVIRE